MFFTIFGLIYLVDFMEMLRRAERQAERQRLALVAGLSFLRTPAIAEQILPFAVLFGAMGAFINLTRKLELVVARAAGVSVWQFLAPAVIGALGLGIFATSVFNPASALMHERANEIETSIFKGRISSTDTSMWIRQKSKDGQSILRAETSSEMGLKLGTVSAYVFDPAGRFIERVDAEQARMQDGAWRLEKAVVTAPAVDPKLTEIYLLATNLAPRQVVQSFVEPDSVPFWSLPRVVADTDGAGLDAVGYRLRFQSLLALPFLLVAMVLIAASFSLKLSRMGGVGVLVLGGVGAGFVLYVASKLVSDLGGAGVLSAPVAAWSPAVVANMLGALTLLNREDG